MSATIPNAIHQSAHPKANSFEWICRLNAHTFITILFFFSGAIGLAYEVIWFRRFAHIWGNSTTSMAAVVACFLFGLGIGASLFGRFAKGTGRPLQCYGFCEILIGLLALIIPHLSSPLTASMSLFDYYFRELPLVYFLVRSAITFLIIGPSCILMGGTLPLLVRQYSLLQSTPHEVVGWLYAVNTFGAAIGCYVTGFHLLPAFGTATINSIAASGNFLIAILAMLLAATLPRSGNSDFAEGVEFPAKQPTKAAKLRICAVTLASALSGCAALILQMIWTRQLSLILGGSTYAFTSTLFVVLVGIGLGSAIFHFAISKLPQPMTVVIPAVILILAVSIVIGSALLPELSTFVGTNRTLRTSQFGNSAISIAAATMVQLLPSIGMGILFPLLVRLAQNAKGDLARTVGNVYASNAIGSIVGAVSTSSILIPTLGTSKTTAIAIGLYLATLMLIMWSRGWQEYVASIVFSLPISAAVLVACREHDPRATNSGMYLYGAPIGRELSNFTTLYFREGANCNVLITRHDKSTSLRVNGKVDASDGSDMRMQLGLAYFPLMIRPDSREILIIGFGSGTTSGAAVLFPDTLVTTCEIEPAIVSASKHFKHVNHSPEKSDRLKVVIDDGRRFILGTENHYDLILSEPSNPWIAGISNLFTREFYLTARERLKTDGVFAQWLQSYSMTPAEYTLVARTLRSVFPHCAMVRVTSGDTILLASDSSVSITPESLDGFKKYVASLPAVQSDLSTYFGTTDVRSLAMKHFWLDTRGLERFAGPSSPDNINTDINMRLEFDAPLHLFKSKLLSSNGLSQSIVIAGSAQQFKDEFHRLGCSVLQLDALEYIVETLLTEQQVEQARELVDFAIGVDPTNPYFMSTKFILTKSMPGNETQAAVSRIVGCSIVHAGQMGVSLWRSKDYQNATIVFEHLVKKSPYSATAWANLGINYDALEKYELAEQAFNKAVLLDPLNPLVIESISTFRKSRLREQTHQMPTAP